MNFFSMGPDIDIMGKDERSLEVLRYSSGADSTLGLLSEVGPDGREFLAYTLEDEWREEKVSAETRIPEGTYNVTLIGSQFTYEKIFSGRRFYKYTVR